MFSVQSVVVLMTVYVVIGPIFYSTVVLVVLITVYGMCVHGMNPSTKQCTRTGCGHKFLYVFVPLRL